MQRIIFRGDIMLLKMTAVSSVEFSKFAVYVM